MKLIWGYTKTYLRELTRNSSALFFTLFFPAILLIFFGNNNEADRSIKLINYIIYCNFAVQTVMLQALGIAFAAARANPWNDYLKTLPVTPVYMAVGRILSSLIFALLSLSIVTAVNFFTHGVNLTLWQNSLIILCALIGGIPMGLLAVWLGDLFNPAASRGAFIFLNTVLLFVVLDFSWGGPLKEIVPSYQWMMFSLSVISKQNFYDHLRWLVSYGLIFYLLIQFSDWRAYFNSQE
jgi:hypothetical protein